MVIVAGLVVVLLGMLRESRRRRRAGDRERCRIPAIDLNDPRQRARFARSRSARMVMFVVLAFAGYNGFLLTESVPFCGKHVPHADGARR